MLSKIPYGRQWLTKEDIKAVGKALRADFLTCGPKVEEFEKRVANYCGAKHAVACSSGTTGLHLAYLAIGLQKGDEVIMPSLTFSATAAACSYCGAVPVFCDIEKGSLNIAPEEIEKRITKKTKAIAVVDFAGHPCDFDKIKEIAKKHNLFLIEDAAHAIGSVYKGKKIGSISDLTVFSFHPVKTMTTGEGGIVLTNNKKFAERMKKLRHHGIEKKEDWKYEIKEIGYNYRITDFQCALGLSQFKKLNKFIQRRRQIVKMYQQGLKNEDLFLLEEKPYVKSAWHIYPVQVKNRKKVYRKLKQKGIFTQVHYVPLHFQPVYKKYKKGDLSETEKYYKKALTLPLYPKMTDNDVQRVIRTLKELL